MKTLEQISAEYKVYPELHRLYRHYKGGVYEVLHLATHSETDEVMVVYKSVLFGSYHVRPLSMWFDIIHEDEYVIDKDNKSKNILYRFTLI